MRVRALALVLLLCGLAACGGSTSGLRRTPANVAACKVLREVLAGRARVQALAGAVLETNAPITQKLRQDLGQFAIDAATAGVAAAQQSVSQASQDCAAIGS
jgi:hypothetical protein